MTKKKEPKRIKRGENIIKIYDAPKGSAFDFEERSKAVSFQSSAKKLGRTSIVNKSMYVSGYTVTLLNEQDKQKYII